MEVLHRDVVSLTTSVPRCATSTAYAFSLCLREDQGGLANLSKRTERRTEKVCARIILFFHF